MFADGMHIKNCCYAQEFICIHLSSLPNRSCLNHTYVSHDLKQQALKGGSCVGEGNTLFDALVLAAQALRSFQIVLVHSRLPPQATCDVLKVQK